MSWRTLNTWSRWLVLHASAPPIQDGSISLSSVGVKMSLRALCAAAVPELLPESAVIDSFDQIWDRVETEPQRERFVLFLEWLVLADSKCAQRLMSLTPQVLTPAEAWRASAPVVFDDPAGAIAGSLARQWLSRPLRAAETPSTSTLTRSQTLAYQRISAMARAFFAQQNFPCAIQPRLMPLILGPTGSGKTSLLRRVAMENKATFIRTSLGEWVPIGVRSARPTIVSILAALANSSTGATIVLVDEIDKASGVTDSTWARSALNEVYATLDRSLPIDAVTGGESHFKPSISVDELKARVETKLFIAAAGTWQSLWSGGTMGFGGKANRGSQVLEHIASQKIVPPELLMRFSWPPITLQYPDPGETAELFEKTGLRELAANVGVSLDAVSHDWTKGGLRSLESIAGDLLVRLHDLSPNHE